MSNQVQTFEEYVNSKKGTNTEDEKSSKNSDMEKEPVSKTENDNKDELLLSKSCTESMNNLVEMMVTEMKALDESLCESYVKESTKAFDGCKAKIQEAYEGSKKKEEPKEGKSDNPKKKEDKETKE